MDTYMCPCVFDDDGGTAHHASDRILFCDKVALLNRHFNNIQVRSKDDEGIRKEIKLLARRIPNALKK